MNNNTFLDILAHYQTKHNFSKKLGIMSKSAIITGLTQYLNTKELKPYLNKSYNLFQIIQVIQNKTQELKKPRTAEQIQEFELKLQRLIKMARL